MTLMVSISRSNALRWNAYTSGRLSLNGSNETDYVGYEFPRRTVGTREGNLPDYYAFQRRSVGTRKQQTP